MDEHFIVFIYRPNQKKYGSGEIAKGGSPRAPNTFFCKTVDKSTRVPSFC